MGHVVNGRKCLLYSTVLLEAGADNVPNADEYLVLLPQQADERVVGFIPYSEMFDLNWVIEVANGDPSQTKDILFIGGAPEQDPPEIVLPSGFTALRLKPGRAQRIAYISGTGFCVLLAGELEV